MLLTSNTIIYTSRGWHLEWVNMQLYIRNELDHNSIHPHTCTCLPIKCLNSSSNIVNFLNIPESIPINFDMGLLGSWRLHTVFQPSSTTLPTFLITNIWSIQPYPFLNLPCSLLNFSVIFNGLSIKTLLYTFPGTLSKLISV